MIMGKSKARRFKPVGFTPTAAEKPAAGPGEQDSAESLHAEDLLRKVISLYILPGNVHVSQLLESVTEKRVGGAVSV